jgi:hypothetical protein
MTIKTAATEAVKLKAKTQLCIDKFGYSEIGFMKSELKTIAALLDSLAPIVSGEMVVVPADPGIGFFDAVQRGLEEEGPNEMGDAFAEWNGKRHAMIEETP